MMENEPCQAPAGPRLFYKKPAIIRRHLLPEEEGQILRHPFYPAPIIKAPSAYSRSGLSHFAGSCVFSVTVRRRTIRILRRCCSGLLCGCGGNGIWGIQGCYLQVSLLFCSFLPDCPLFCLPFFFLFPFPFYLLLLRPGCCPGGSRHGKR